MLILYFLQGLVALPSPQLGVVATEKGTLGSPSISVSNYYYYYYKSMHSIALNHLWDSFPLFCPVSCDCRIRWLLLCRGVRPLPAMSVWIWHKSIWWWGSRNAEVLGKAEYPSIATASRSTLAGSGSIW